MIPEEQGFLLLTSHLGNPARYPLTVAQFRTLAGRVSKMERPKEDRILEASDLMRLGYEEQMALRIIRLLEDRLELSRYVQRGNRQHCIPITRVSEAYPLTVRKKLGLDAPGCLWAKGNPELLQKPAVSLVGSRDIRRDNRDFAALVGAEAARQGYVLVSGNARGADRTAQDACLEQGGSVVSVVADELQKQPENSHILYLSEEGYDSPFSSQRALSRNRVIHCLGSLTFVAQSNLGRGGTWDGTVKNLRNRWSPVFCCPDGSQGIRGLVQMGAVEAEPNQLADFAQLQNFETEMRMEEFL